MAPPTSRPRLPRRLAALIVCAALPALSTTASAEPPAASWHPVSMTATRAGVHIEPRFEPGAATPTGARVRVANTNPFPVTLHDLQVPERTPRFEALHTSPAPITLAPGQARIVLLEVARWRKITREAHALGGQAPARFSLTIPDEALDQAAALLADVEGALGMTYGPDPTEAPAERLPLEALDPPPFEAAWRLKAISALLDAELRTAVVLDHVPAGLRQGQRRAGALASRLEEVACQVEARVLGDALARDGEHLPATLARFVQLTGVAERRAPLRACLGPELDAALVGRAMEIGANRLAADLSAPHAAGPHTPAPFKEALIHEALERAEGLWRAEDIYELTRALDALEALASLDPGHEALPERLQTLFDRAEDEAARQREDREFERADRALDLMARAEGLAPTSALADALSQQRLRAASALALARGRFIFHYQRAQPGALARADEAFDEARAQAPVIARAYQGAISLVEHQFLVLFLLLGGGLGFWLGLRSQAWARLRLRLAVAGARRAARRSPRQGADRAWRAMARLMALAPSSRANQRLRGQLADGLIQVAQRADDRHLMAEALGQLQQLGPQDRPRHWQKADSHALALLGSVDDLICAPDPEPLAHRERQVELRAQLFGNVPEVIVSKALLDEARLRRELAAGMTEGAARALMAQTLEALRAADAFEADTLPLVSLRQGLRLRLAILLAELGPAMGIEPQAAWAEAWALLDEAPGDGQDVLELGSEPLAWARARALAAATCAPVERAVEVIEEATGLIDQLDSQGADRLREAMAVALRETARRAVLPLPDPSDAPEAHDRRRLRALLALARLDNLLTAHLTPDDALDARLRVAILRRLGGRASGQLEADVEYQQDIEALFASARARRDLPTTSALACVLDLLTEGDWGFDQAVASAQGAQRSLYQLLDALDHHASGRAALAAAALADVDPSQAPPARATRVLCARAVVALGIGQRQAALEALGRALERAEEPASLAVARLTAGRLVGVTLEATRAGLPGAPAMLEQACLGLLQSASLPDPPVAWHALASVMIAHRREQTAALLLERSRRLEHTPQAASARRAALLALSAQAMVGGYYDRAHSYAMMAGGEAVPKSVLSEECDAAPPV